MVVMIREYGLPFVLAMVIHIAAAAALWGGWMPEQPQVRELVRPNIIHAELLVLEPPPQLAPPPRLAPPQPDPREQQRREAERREAERQQAARRDAERRDTERRAAERRAAERQEAERREAERRQAERREAERREAERRAEQERQRRLQEMAARTFDQSLAREAENLARSQDTQLVQSYSDRIYQQVAQNWSRPLSARRGMQVELQVDLVPTGEIVGVTIVRSSGDAAFDRSAEQAVRRVGRFEVPSDSRVFDANFRRFILRFNPEDLLR
jgi:colicin import membrane protein